jgi:hypothetical protein
MFLSGGRLTAIRQWRIIEASGADRDSHLYEADHGAARRSRLRGLSVRLAANPGLGALIKGGGGIRKIRVAVGSRGKRGGARVIYYWAVRKDLILLLFAYPKNVSADLTPKQVAQLAKVVKEEFRDETENV